MNQGITTISTENLSRLGALLVEIICHRDSSHELVADAAELLALELRMNLAAYRAKFGPSDVPTLIFEEGAPVYGEAIDALGRALHAQTIDQASLHHAVLNVLTRFRALNERAR